MKRLTSLLMLFFVLGMARVEAQSSCTDLNGYVNHKNTGGVGSYTLSIGNEEKAAQTYRYSGPGKISSVRLYGNYPTTGLGGVPLRVAIYNVDANGRPTSQIQSANVIWWWYNNPAGYIDVSFGSSAVVINNNFAVEVEIRNVFPFGNSFNLGYTGNGEGLGEDLASLAGTSTGDNWTSAKVDFSKDGDFYLVPRMTNFITSNFTASATCIAPGSSVSFTNNSQMSLDSMFNTIGLSGYSGSSHYYEWNFGDGSAVSNAVSPSHTFATAGVYTVSLKSTLVGWYGTCNDTKTMQISVGLSVATSNLVNVTCHGLSNGSLAAVASGGASPYVYSLNGIQYQSSASFSGLPAGSYTLYIKDNLGCANQTPFNITEPAAISFSPASITNATCGHSDGGILVVANGGTGSLQYQLGNGTFQSTGSFSNLLAGSYTINAKDANSCSASILVAVNDAGGPSLTVTSTTNVSCNGQSDGSIVLNATGGSGVLQYSIDGGSTYQTNGSFLNIPSGTYAAMVKDAAGCSHSLILNITQPQGLVLTTSAKPASCHGMSNGEIHVTSASGGTGSFTYSVNGTVYQSSPNFLGLAAGTYTVYVKDAAGCTKTATQVVSEPTVLTATVTTNAANCNGSFDGSITVNATGGTSGYVYSVFDTNYQTSNTFVELSAGSYGIRVRDANNCQFYTTATITQPTPIAATINTTASTCGNSNGDFLVTPSGGSGSGYQFSINDTNFNSTGSFTGLASGTYYVIVTDGANCRSVFSTTIMDANGPSIVSNTHTNVSCNQGSDGSISITSVTGGTGILQYTINGTVWQTSPTFIGLPAGRYFVTVKDANGCTGTIVQVITEPNAFVMTSQLTNNRCNGDATGSATILASGGSGVFAYSIDNGTFQSSNVFNGLTAGTHTVTVRDAASCSSDISFTLSQPTKIDVAAGVLDVSCYNVGNGAISVTTSGGTGHYQFSLNNGSYQSSSVFENLDGGLYNVFVKDSSNCVATLSVVVNEPTALIATGNVHNVSCAGGSNGSISLQTTGGTSPYVYIWSTESFSEDLFNLTAGTYSVQVWDDNGCSFTDSYEVTQPSSPLIVNGVVTDASTSTSSDGSVSLTTTGGEAPYNYLWTNGTTAADLNDVGAGTYGVNITDVNGCVTTGTFIVGSATGIDNLDAVSNSVSVYPNPTNGLATIEVKGSVINSMRVIDVYGKVVFETEPKQYNTTINTNTFAAGIYVVQVQIDGHYVTKKLLVTK